MNHRARARNGLADAWQLVVRHIAPCLTTAPPTPLAPVLAHTHPPLCAQALSQLVRVRGEEVVSRALLAVHSDSWLVAVASVRAMVSVVPPAGAPTKILIGC